MRPGRPATVRFYIDADILGLAKVLVQVRADVTYPGDPGGTLHLSNTSCLSDHIDSRRRPRVDSTGHINGMVDHYSWLEDRQQSC